MVGGIEVIGVHGGEVLDLKFDEGRSEFRGVAEGAGEGVYAVGKKC